MKTGIEIIAEERQRQIEVEGWTPKHDAQHEGGEMATAAACYAVAPMYRGAYKPEFSGIICKVAGWPWADEWWKPCPEDRIHELAKAGALIAAEIDRLNNISDETTLQP